MRARQNIYVASAGWWYFAEAMNTDMPNITQPGDGGPIGRFLEETVVATDQQEAFLSTISFMFNDKFIVDDKLLGLLEGLSVLSTASPQIYLKSSPKVLADIRFSCSVACQRQLCSGAREDDDMVCQLLGMFFHWLWYVYQILESHRCHVSIRTL